MSRTQPPAAGQQSPSQSENTGPYAFLTAAYFITLGLLSANALFLEIALTRFFSTLFFPPYVFAIISIAVLGIGLGAAIATVSASWRAPAYLPSYLALAGYATLALLLITSWTVSIDLRGALLLLVLVPYLFVGLALATIFGTASRASPRLYRADLLGAGLGAILAIPLLNVLGDSNSILFAAGLFDLSALLAARQAKSSTGAFLSATRWALILIGLAFIGLGTNSLPATRWLTIDLASLASAKPISESLAAGGRIIYTTWDSFARTDLVDPGQGKPYELYIDGAAGSVMPPASELNLLRTDIGFFPFATAQPQQVLVIGPGGGWTCGLASTHGPKPLPRWKSIRPAST